MNQPGLSQPDPMIGTTLAGRYRIEERIGAGAMGAVYRARQAGLGRAVALKILKRDMAWGGDTVQRFRREAKAMSALNHPNTVHVFDFGATDDGLLFLAMELLEGEPITELLARNGAIGMRDSVSYARAVLRSIGEAHVKGIVHRDLKPDNIFLARVEGQAQPVVKVLDFGIAKAIEGDRKIDQFETLDGTVFGTPRYMSPEQAAGKQLDPRSDLYSVGILLYEFLTGHPPFEDADAVVVMAKHIREEPVPLRRSSPERLIPPSLEAVVSKALAKSPADRFQTAEEFDRALVECAPDAARFERLSTSGVGKTPLTWWLMASARARALGAATLIVLLAAAGLSLWLGSQEKPRTVVSSADQARPSVQPAMTPTPSPDQAGGAAPTPVPAAPVVVMLQSEPNGAEVTRDGTQLGVTPLEIVVPQGAMASVSLHKAGFVDHTVELHAGDPARRVELNPLPSSAATPSKAHVTRAVPHARPVRSPQPSADKPAGATPSSPYEKF